jgi:hypothetical protein
MKWVSRLKQRLLSKLEAWLTRKTILEEIGLLVDMPLKILFVVVFFKFIFPHGGKAFRTGFVWGLGMGYILFSSYGLISGAYRIWNLLRGEEDWTARRLKLRWGAWGVKLREKGGGDAE